MRIDDQTWNDLLLDAYSDRLAASASLFGRESLRERLRAGAGGVASAANAAAGLAATRERVQALMSDGALARAVSAARRPLSACDTSVAGLLADCGAVVDGAATASASVSVLAAALQAAPRWAGYLWLLPVAFLLSAALALFWWPLWPVALATWLLLMLLQVSYHSRMQTWHAVVQSLQALLRTHANLAGIANPDLQGFSEDAQAADKLCRQPRARHQ